MEFHQLLHQGQAQTRALVTPTHGTFGLAEPFKEVGNLVGPNPDPRIAHLQQIMLPRGFHRDRDRSAARRELHGIGEQVIEHLIEALAV